MADKTSSETSRVFVREWLFRYPRPKMTTHDNGTEFTQEFQKTLQSCGIRRKPITVENLWPNLVERMCQTLGDMIRTENFEDIENPMREVEFLLSSCTWALRSTASFVIGKNLGQLIHSEDMTMQVVIDVVWSETLRKKRKFIKKTTN